MTGMGMPGGSPGAPGTSAKKAKSSKDTEKPKTEEELKKEADDAKKLAAERRKKARERLAKQPDEPDVFAAGGGGASSMGPGASGQSMPMYSGAGRAARPRRGTSMVGEMMPEAMPGSSRMPGMQPRRRLARGDEEEEAEEPPEVEFLLFRFFDFSVKPGVYYRYRVKLVLANPNFGMPSQFLEQEGMEKARFLETEWSEPSPAVPAPVDSQVLAVSSKGSSGEASLMVLRFMEEDGYTAAKEITVQRGQLLDYRGEEFTPPASTAATGPMGGMGSMAGMPGGSVAPGAAPRERKVDYLTNSLLLDVAGGGRLPGKDRSLTEPGSILLLDREGKLVVRNELDDLADYTFYKPPEKKEGVAGPGSTYSAGMESPGMAADMYAQPGKKGGSKKGAKGSPSLPPGMMPGAMPGAMPGSSAGMQYLDDKGKKKKGR
jgi:hypothetical protein